MALKRAVRVIYHNVLNLLKFIVHIIIVEYVYFDTYYFFVFALPKITATVPFIDVTVLVVLKGSDILAKVCARPTAAPIFYTFQRPCDVSLEGTVTVHSWKWETLRIHLITFPLVQFFECFWYRERVRFQSATRILNIPGTYLGPLLLIIIFLWLLLVVNGRKLNTGYWRAVIRAVHCGWCERIQQKGSLHYAGSMSL